MGNNWQTKLNERVEKMELRQLKPKNDFIDFSANDYLGFATDESFQNLLMDGISSHQRMLTSATGSRLISGNSQQLTETESFIAKLHRYDDCLLFGSGYQANLALFSCLLGHNDTYIVDEYIHRSVHDGCRLSDAKKWKFKHNDLMHLEALLKKATGEVVVAVESLYSMDGDWAPLPELVVLTSKYNAKLIVDEAHAMGIKGLGFVDALALQQNVFAVVKTYGKAMGVQGGVVLCSKKIKDYLVNFASPFIYTTAPSGVLALSIHKSYHFLESHADYIDKLKHNISFFYNHYKGSIRNDSSPIQIILKEDVSNFEALLNNLFENKLQVYVVNAPTVVKGKERIRICLHANHTESQIKILTTLLNNYL